MEVSGSQQMAYENDYMNITAKNFVLAADLTWDTQYGDSGCGFMFISTAVNDILDVDGFLSMLGLPQGGRTMCQFDKAWLWLPSFDRRL